MASLPGQQALQDDIDLFKTLLQSLDESGHEDAESRQYYVEKLAELNEQLTNMGNVLSTGRPPSTSHSSSNNSFSPRSRQLLSLPSRKRERGEFEDDINTDDMPRIKSRRSTPAAASPVGSRADSVSSDYFEDPELLNLLGDSWRNGIRTEREYQKQQDRKRQQEEEDEKLARQLQEEWSMPNSTFQPQVPRPSFPSASQTQATFRPNGSFARPVSDSQAVRDDADGPAADTPISLSSSDDDFALVSSAEFNTRFPSSNAQPRTLPPSFGRPPQNHNGDFLSYTSMPGTSVYGSARQDQQSGILGSLPGLSALNPLPALNVLLGSASNPYDFSGLANAVCGGTRGPPLPDTWATVDPKETQEEIRQLLHNIRPDEEIDISEASESQPEGLKVRLMPHQLKGVKWMQSMEDSSTKGGILADDMGLGKTVQAIALMLSRPPPTGKGRAPTLVVTPVALMEQWKREIAKMVRSSAALSVVILHGQKAHVSWADIRHRDVVLTSYGTLTSELRKKIKWDDKLKSNPDAKQTKKEVFGILDDKARFHRVILDEAQNIKNRSTQAAVAACRVDAKFRWCLSGTPMQNSVDEIFSLIRFCRIRPYNELEKFSKDISRPLKARHEVAQQGAMNKLQALLKAILLRRTKKSLIDGKPILQLPEKHTKEDRAIFSKDQLDFYKALETQSQIQFNRYVKQGSVGRNYSKALVLLLRLRQCCCSPQLITNSADFVTDSGVEGLDLVANARELPQEVITRLKDQEDEVECPVCMDAVDNAMIFECGHATCHDCFSRLVDTVGLNNDEVVRCPHCRAIINTKKITDYASFKEVHLGEGGPQVNADEDDEDTDSDSLSDSDSENSFLDDSDDGRDLRDFIVNDDDSDAIKDEDLSEDEDDDLNTARKPKKGDKSSRILDEPKLEDSASEAEDDDNLNSRKTRSEKSKGKQQKKKSRKGKKKAKVDHKSLADLRKEGVKSAAAKKKYLKQLAKIYQPCAKIDKVLETLNEIHERGENEKAIIFSSFTSFLDLIEVPLREQPHLCKYARYDGSMTAKKRNEEVLRFTDDPDCRIMLVSLKAGNAGLNLTVANHVLLCDPFWNPFVEYQAADRCYRIGQRREVTVHRVLIGEEGFDHAANPEYQFTVEDRILALQEKKRRLVESALDENASSSVARLGIRELGYLFGVNDLPARNGT